MELSLSRFKPDQRVRITQTIAWGRHKDVVTVDGTIIRLGQQKTGSWFAHARDDKLWIDRIELKRDDGEIVVCNLDQNSVVDALDGDGATLATERGDAAAESH